MMRYSLKALTALFAVSFAVAMGAARAQDASKITLLCQTTNSGGVSIGMRTVHIDLGARDVNDTQVYDGSTPVVTNETHARITRITDQIIAWRPYELISHYGGKDVLTKIPFPDLGTEDVVDRYTLTITSSAYTSRCTLQTRKI